jgi:probable metal-binding protein
VSVYAAAGRELPAEMTPVMRPGAFLPQNPGMAMEPLPDQIVMGHEVLDLILERGGSCTLTELRADAQAKFGPGAVFGNCHGDRFAFDGLVEFLASKGKVARQGEEVSLGQVPGCSGHGHAH